MGKDAYYYMVANEQYENGQIEEAIKFFLKSLEMEYHFKTYEKFTGVIAAYNNMIQQTILLKELMKKIITMIKWLIYMQRY